jgi:hypothetical protein
MLTGHRKYFSGLNKHLTVSMIKGFNMEATALRSTGFLPKPIVLEATASAGSDIKTIVVDKLPPEGATLVVACPDVRKGDMIHVYETTPGFEYDCSQTAETDGEILRFNIPKELFFHAGIALAYTYILLNSAGDIVGVSEEGVYLKTAFEPERVKGPIVSEAQVLENSPIKILKIEELEHEFATLVVQLPEGAAGHLLTLWIQTQEPYEETVEIKSGKTEYIHHIAKPKLNDEKQTLSVSFVIRNRRGSMLYFSANTLYLKKPGFNGVR